MVRGNIQVIALVEANDQLNLVLKLSTHQLKL